MHRIAVLALPATVMIDLSIPLQIFGHEDQNGFYVVDVCAPRASVPTTSGVSLTAQAGLDGLRDAETVVVAGFEPFAPDPEVLAALRDAARRGARMVSICTGAFALAEAGLLDGRRATTHWHHTAELAARRPAVDVVFDVLYVDHGDVATSAGVAAGIDLCLHLLRTDRGAAEANKVARRMVVMPHREGGQAQFVDHPVPLADDGLGPTCQWALERLGEPLTIDDLARRAGQSPRTFNRRFRAETGTTPLRWLTEQRLAAARALLEETDLPVPEVARRAGFGSAVSMRAHFARALSTAPTAYRRAFGRRLGG